MINRLLSWLDSPRAVPRSHFVPDDFQPPAQTGHGLDLHHWARRSRI